MAIKIKIPKNGGNGGKGTRGMPRDPVIRAALVIFLVVAIGLKNTAFETCSMPCPDLEMYSSAPIES